MADTTTITLRSQSRSVIVKAPASGYRANPEIDQKVSVSGGGTIYTTDFGGETQKLQVQLRRLTRTEYAALEDFILTTCRGSAFSFDLTDYRGTHPNLHYISGLEGAERHRGDLFNVTLQLQKSTGQSIRLGQNLITNPNLIIGSDGKIDGWVITPYTSPSAIRNVEIDEDFSEIALEMTERNYDPESVLTNPIPIGDLQYEVSGRATRTNGQILVRVGAQFFDENNALIVSQGVPSSGWNSRGAGFYSSGVISGRDANDTWRKFSSRFGPGIGTYIPPEAKSFRFGAWINNQIGAATFRFSDFSVVASL